MEDTSFGADEPECFAHGIYPPHLLHSITSNDLIGHDDRCREKTITRLRKNFHQGAVVKLANDARNQACLTKPAINFTAHRCIWAGQQRRGTIKARRERVAPLGQTRRGKKSDGAFTQLVAVSPHRQTYRHGAIRKHHVQPM